MLDILIKNGEIIDGLNLKRETKDLGIKNGKIVKIGNLENQKAKIEINAQGFIISPGFIEINSLVDRDFSLLYYPQAENYLAQGVTTVIGGGCGASFFPLITGSLDIFYKWIDHKKININWQKADEFFNLLKNKGIGVNFGALISWGVLRKDLTNGEFRPLTKEEKEKLKFLITKTLKEGALGVSFGLGYEEERAVGIDEILAVLELVKKFNGYLAFKLRDEKDGFLVSLREVLEVAQKGDISLEIYQFKVLGKENYKYFSDGLKLIEEANQEKELVNFDISPYEVIESPLMDFLPDWAAVGGFKVFLKNIREPVIRLKLINDLKKEKEILKNLVISNSKNKPLFIGKTIQELALGFNLSIEETVIKVLELNEGLVSVFVNGILKENLEKAISSKYSFISAASGFYPVNIEKMNKIIHPSSFGTFIKFIKEYTKAKKVYSLEEAINKLTYRVAKKIGLKDRGLIKENYWADLVIFSYEKLDTRADFINPILPPVGIDTVIVNGKIAYRRGIFECQNAGEIIKR